VTVTHPQRGDTRLIFIFIFKKKKRKKKKEEVKTHSRIEEEEKKKDNIFVFKLTPNLENCGIYSKPTGVVNSKHKAIQKNI
jgi:hypothetical protein